MTPQKQKSPLKVVKANGKARHLLQQTGRLRPSIGRHSSLESRTGKPFWNTARTARSSCRETLRIPCGISTKAR